MEKIVAGIQKPPAKLHGDTCDDAAQAIMTTDTFPKQVAVELTLDGKQARLGAIAKGSGMIAPEHGDHAGLPDHGRRN